MRSTKRVEPLDGFFQDVRVRQDDAAAQWRIKAGRSLTTPEYLAWCTWLTRDEVSRARDRHTVPFSL